MRFRPCIDIHKGRVKQIVGSSLSVSGDAVENFVSEKGAEYYADMYKKMDLSGGHVIMLDPVGSEYRERDEEQVFEALRAFEGGLQVGGGITPANAYDFIARGASHVIVTSFVFRDGRIDMNNLYRMLDAVGRKRLVLDLSCRRVGEDFYIVTDRWTKLTDVRLERGTLEWLAEYCDEFLVHAADAEGKQQGIEYEAAAILSGSPIPCTYAGGIATMQDIEDIRVFGVGKLDFTVGSALDIFGGNLPIEKLLKVNS